MKWRVSLVLVLAASYKLPPKEIAQIIDTPPTPDVVISPSRDAMMLIVRGVRCEVRGN